MSDDDNMLEIPEFMRVQAPASRPSMTDRKPTTPRDVVARILRPVVGRRADEEAYHVVEALRAAGHLNEWRPIDEAAKKADQILAWRKDAGMFMAHFISPADAIGADDDEPDWFTTSGEHLPGAEMPTHYMIPKPPGDGA